MEEWLRKAGEALEHGNGKQFAAMLWISATEVQQIVSAMPTNFPVGTHCNAVLRHPYGQVVAYALQAACAYCNDKPEPACAAYLRSVEVFLQEFRDGDGDECSVESLKTMCSCLRLLAAKADGIEGKSKQSDASMLLRRFVQPTVTSRVKKQALLRVTNTLLKLYFALNTLGLCKNITKLIDAQCGKSPGEHRREFGIADQVTFAYYMGRLCVLNDEYERAERELEFAFQRCHHSYQRNKQRALRHLVPVKLLRGKVPTPQLLYQYSLGQYEPLVEAMKLGDVKRLDDALINNQERLVEDGVFLPLERTRDTVYRTLIKRVFNITAAREDNERAKHQLELWRVQVALAWVGEPKDMEEIECIIASLISRKLVRGIISHKKSVLVLSKTQPFPPLTQVLQQ